MFQFEPNIHVVFSTDKNTGVCHRTALEASLSERGWSRQPAGEGVSVWLCPEPESKPPAEAAIDAVCADITWLAGDGTPHPLPARPSTMPGFHCIVDTDNSCFLLESRAGDEASEQALFVPILNPYTITTNEKVVINRHVRGLIDHYATESPGYIDEGFWVVLDGLTIDRRDSRQEAHEAVMEHILKYGTGELA